MSRNTLNTLKDFPLAGGQSGQFYSLPALGESLGVEEIALLTTTHDPEARRNSYTLLAREAGFSHAGSSLR